ncbi:unnamed protein product [Gadus morhua 'NCC']
MHQLGDEDCILPSKLQAALQQVLEERELILGQEAEQKGASPGGYPNNQPSLAPLDHKQYETHSLADWEVEERIRLRGMDREGEGEPRLREVDREGEGGPRLRGVDREGEGGTRMRGVDREGEGGPRLRRVEGEGGPRLRGVDWEGEGEGGPRLRRLDREAPWSLLMGTG